MIQVTEILSEFAAQLKFEDMPMGVLEETKKFIADYIASVLGGYQSNPLINSAVLTLMDEMGGKEQSSVLFGRRKLPASNAAFVNALYSNGADYDDGNRKAAGHIGSHVMSSVFALAETMAVSWEAVFVAINVGYEVFNRIAGAAQPDLYLKGFHSTGIAGSIASGAACAKLIGLDSNGIYNAISLGALHSSGLIIIDESGQACKPINPANAARSGVISAQLAAKAISCPRNPLESKKGWFNAFSDNLDQDTLLEGLGKTYTISESYMKIYPTCRHTHSVIEAASNIGKKLETQGQSLEDIERIVIDIYPSAIRSAGSIRRPSNPDEAKFSLHYCAAISLATGGFQLDDLICEHIDPTILNLIDRIELVSDCTMENRALGLRGARITAHLTDAGKIVEIITIPKGEAENPLSWDDIENKMAACSRGLGVSPSAIIENIVSLKPCSMFSIWTSWIKQVNPNLIP